MQPMTILAQREESGEKRHLTHKRMERWIRLQQFVYGLPDDYAYAICTRETADGRFESQALVKVGWMTWFGAGRGAQRQQSLAVALLDTEEALSANNSRTFLHGIRFWFKRRVAFLRGAAGVSAPKETKIIERDRIAS